MKLLTKQIRERLIKNGRLRQHLTQDGASPEPDFLPVVKLLTPDAGATWLLTEIDPHDYDRAFGLCDLGLGTPELGYVSLRELAALRGPLGLHVERLISISIRRGEGKEGEKGDGGEKLGGRPLPAAAQGGRNHGRFGALFRRRRFRWGIAA